MPGTDPIAAHEAWRAQRLAQVTGPVGNLALVDYQPVGADPEPVRGMPALVRREPGEAGVRVRATGPGLRIRTADDDQPVEEETLLPLLGPDGLPLLTAGTLTVDAFSLDGRDIELRRYDAAAPALTDFDGIETAAYDPSWIVPATFEAHTEPQRVPWAFTRETDSGHTKAVPGTLRTSIDGTEQVLTVFADGPALVLVFADATTGVDSYAPGRFLRLEAAEPGARVSLDFNRAIVPPCGFSDFYSCPIPPRENRLAVPVRAGELRARWRSDR